jgi:hypothetical protein
MERSLKQAFEWIEELQEELHLPGVSMGTYMNRPSLKHRGKSIIGSKDGKALVVHCPLEIKDVLLEIEPEVYFQTDHYKGYPALLIRPAKVDKDCLRTRILAAWHMYATEAQLAAYQDGNISEA